MALINKVSNTAHVDYNGTIVNSNTVDTLLLLAPTVSKTVNKLTAVVGDTLIYTVTITNLALSPLTNIPFSDIIDVGAIYIADTFKVNGTAQTPTITGTKLSYTIPTIAALGVATVQFQVEIVGGQA